MTFIIADSLMPAAASSPVHAIITAVLPVGVIAGLLGGWWNERVGGGLAIIWLACIYYWQIETEPGSANPLYYMVALVPSVLFLFAAVMSRVSGEPRED